MAVTVAALCLILDVVEISRNGWNTDNWGMLADTSELLMSLLAALLLARRALRSSEKGWAWLAWGSWAWAVGQVAWMVIEFGLHKDPTVSVATIGFVGWAALTTIGLLKLGGRSSALASIGVVISEALVLAASIGFLVWELALAPAVSTESNFTMIMLAIVPLSESLVIATALLLCLHERPLVIVMFGVAACVLLTADSLLTVWFAGNAEVLAVAHLLYLTTFAMIAIAAVLPHSAAMPPTTSSLRRLLVIYPPLTLAIWVGTWRYLVQQADATVVSIGIAFAIGVLLALNQVTAWFDARQLAARLQNNITKLREAETELRSLLDDLPEAVVVLSDHGVVLDLNALTLKLTGLTRPELIGQSFATLLDEADLRKLADMWRRMLNHESLDTPTFKLTHVNGSVAIVEADVHTAIHDRNRIVVTLRDITKRLQTSAELEQAQTRFRLAFQSAPTGMVLSSAADGCILDVNETLAAMLGTSRDLLIGKSVQDITHPDDWSANARQLEQALGGAVSSYKLDKRYLRADGQVVWARTSVGLMTGDQGSPLVIAHVEDITEQRRTAEHLQWAASHDELTGLPNRAHFLDQLSKRLDGAPLGSIAVLFIDLDNFKVVNDSL